MIIKALFGGVVESAKNDERKEFKKMLDFVKKDRSISAILVYSYERFSRSEHAADLSRELGKIGVKVLSVIQEVDVTSAAGRLQQNIFYAFGNYDNELRREKTTRGMIENLRNGYFFIHFNFMININEISF
jgi:DNA invertase Pin-like site-specific DNA recombinase